MPTVYGVNASPFVRKVRIALAEKGVAYDLEPVFPGAADEAFRKLSPLGKVPAFRDGERTLADSSVICAYLDRVHPTPALYPTDPYDYARALWFEEYGDSALGSNLTGTLFFQRIVAPRFFGRATDDGVVTKALSELIPPMLTYLESQLDGEYLVGRSFSIADIGVITHFVNAQHAGFSVDQQQYPKLARYVGRMLARPSIKTLLDEEAPQFMAA